MLFLFKLKCLKKSWIITLLLKYNNEVNVCVTTKTIITLAFLSLCDLHMSADELVDKLMLLFEWFEEF